MGNGIQKSRLTTCILQRKAPRGGRMNSSQNKLLLLFIPDPCPFCGEELVVDWDDLGMVYIHLDNDCIMAGCVLEDIDDVRLWQTRVVGQHQEKSEK
jgi:hypothetical protein